MMRLLRRSPPRNDAKGLLTDLYLLNDLFQNNRKFEYEIASSVTSAMTQVFIGLIGYSINYFSNLIVKTTNFLVEPCVIARRLSGEAILNWNKHPVNDEIASSFLLAMTQRVY